MNIFIDSLKSSDVMDLGQHQFKYWFVAWKHNATTRTNIDLLSIAFFGTNFSELFIEIQKFSS